MGVSVTLPTGSALELAEAMRLGTAPASEYDLWRLADFESNGIREARVTRYRHALVHAGLLLTAKGNRYRRCPMCRGTLSR